MNFLDIALRVELSHRNSERDFAPINLFLYPDDGSRYFFADVRQSDSGRDGVANATLRSDQHLRIR